MNPEEAIKIIGNLTIEENLKNSLVTEIKQNGITDHVKEKLGKITTNINNDINNLDEIVKITNQANSDLDTIDKDADSQINQIANDTEEQLSTLDKEAENADEMLEEVAGNMEEVKKDDIRQSISE